MNDRIKAFLIELYRLLETHEMNLTYTNADDGVHVETDSELSDGFRDREELQQLLTQAGVNTELCPDCKRQKARTMRDAERGLCPKWCAIRDPYADRDCARETRFLELRIGVLERIAKLPLDKQVDENLDDAVRRVFDERKKLEDLLRSAYALLETSGIDNNRMALLMPRIHESLTK